TAAPSLSPEPELEARRRKGHRRRVPHHELADQRLDQARPAERRRPRLPPDAGRAGRSLPILRVSEVVRLRGEVLIPYISNGPLLFWMYPVFGIRGASWVLGMWEWSFALLLFLGFWHKRLGILGALGSCAAFIGTVTIIPFMPDGWTASAGG